MFRLYTCYASWKGHADVKHIFADKKAYLDFVIKHNNDPDFSLRFHKTETFCEKLFITLQSETHLINVHTDGMVHVGEVITNGITCSREQAYTLPKLADEARNSVEGISKAHIEHGNRLYEAKPWL